MSDYISREVAVSYAISGMVRTLPTNDGNENWIRTSEVRKSILSIPAEDVVPVVRCDDCENWQTDWNPTIPDRHYCAVMDSMMKADDFCSYGERKE